jgi:hypothetical protein
MLILVTARCTVGHKAACVHPILTVSAHACVEIKYNNFFLRAGGHSLLQLLINDFQESPLDKWQLRCHVPNRADGCQTDVLPGRRLIKPERVFWLENLYIQQVPHGPSRDTNLSRCRVWRELAGGRLLMSFQWSFEDRM